MTLHSRPSTAPGLFRSFAAVRQHDFLKERRLSGMLSPLRTLILCLVCAGFLAGTTAEVSAADAWQAGVARTTITPENTMWMSGYASRTRPAEGTLHDLWAKALVLQDGDSHQAVLITLDLVGIDRETSATICQRIQKAHGLNRSQIAIATSHTHTGPVVGGNLGTMYFYDDHNARLVNEYNQWLIDAVVQVVADAFGKLEPAELSCGMGSATFAVNRRNNKEADVPKLREAGELVGPVDHAAPVMAVRNQAGKLTAVVFGYACHATVLSFYQWSGDWPGFAQIEIEKAHPDTVAMFVAGCGADQNPLPRRTVELAQNYGKQMATAVNQVLASQMQPVKPGLQTAYKEIDLAYGELPSRDQVQADTTSDNKYVASRARLLLAQLNSQGALDQTYPYPVQVWRVGDAYTVFLGGEVVVDYSLRLRNEFDSLNLWVAGYANDVMAYIPSVRVLKEGGYEGASAMIYYGLPASWSDNVEEHIVDTVKQLVDQVQ